MLYITYKFRYHNIITFGDTDGVGVGYEGGTLSSLQAYEEEESEIRMRLK